MSPLAIPRLVSGGVIPNYHCVSRCGHCLYNCGPTRSRDYLSGETAGGVFRRVAELGCRSVHIGGGEPLLAPEKLVIVLAAARNAGVDIDYVETNAAWFVDKDRAEALLEDLLRAGVRTLLVSISPFHNAAIPFDRVQGVLEACRRVGMGVFPWMETFVGDLSRLERTLTHDMREFEAAFGPDYLRCIPDRYWIHWGGRALATFREVMPTYPLETVLEGSPVSCGRSLADTSHFHIDLYGNYIPGLCAGLAVKMADLGRPLAAGRYPVIDRLASGGIRALYELAVHSYLFEPRQARYLNHCDLCTEIRAFLVKRGGDRFPELAPVEFYAEIG
jgi:hypothetical protein